MINRPFSPHAEAVLALMREEARSLNHAVISASHLFIALLRYRKGVAASILDSVKVRRAVLEGQVIGHIMPGKMPGKAPTELKEDERFQVVMTAALREAYDNRCDEIDTHHLLLGLTLLYNSKVPTILLEVGLTTDEIRKRAKALVKESAPSAS